MTLIAFELSGEHPQIPTAEVIGALEAETIAYSLVDQYDQVLIMEIENVTEIPFLAHRLAMTWHIIEVLGTSDANLFHILQMVEGIEFGGQKSQTYSIRAKKIKRRIQISSEEIERGIGRVLCRRGFRADLKTPDIQYRAVLSDNTCIFGKVLESIDRSVYETRNPQNKPFFYPGVLMPRLARALANIARVRPDDIVLDPYCGTGGLITEAGLVGAMTIGCDVQRMILKGAAVNLDFYSVTYSVLLQDAGDMAIRDGSVDTVLTDPPYGRSALIQASSLEELMRRSLQEMERVLKPGGRAVLVSECDLEDWAIDAGFLVSDVFTQRVHRSLTRRITVLDKNNLRSRYFFFKTMK